MKTKLAFALVAIAVTLGVGTAVALTPHHGTVQAAEVTPAPTATEFTYSGATGKTALELLTAKATTQIKGTGANAYVVAINGRAADDAKKEFWALYVNGVQAQMGAGSYVTKTGDQIRWHVETY